MRLRRMALVAAVVVAVGGSAYIWIGSGSRIESQPAWNPVRAAPSSQLPDTVVLATLDDQLPAAKNAIWCASFQLAWDRLKNDVVKAPVEIRGAEMPSGRLNAGTFQPGDLDPRDFYAAAGWAKDGIAARIREDMMRAFPDQGDPLLDAPTESSPGSAIAYAFLKAGVKFGIPYFEKRSSLMFKDRAGRETGVSSFGIRHEDDYGYFEMRKQVQPLYWLLDKNHKLVEFAVDLDRGSKPYQVIVARIDVKGTLAETIRDLESKFNPPDDYGKGFGPNEVLLVPNIHLDITHRFNELEGRDKPLTTPGHESAFIDRAEQRIVFRLDRSGAEVTSEAKVYMKPIPRYFIYDRPFLVIMKKRGSSKPFLVLWIADAQLLQAWR